MKVNKSELIISAVQPKQYPSDSIAEIAFAGRSNVGKSSLINRLVNRKNLAFTSSQPGKTQTINFYQVNDGEFRFVDLPGYGYAKVSKKERDEWANMIETYLESRHNLCLLILLMDFRHPPTELDRQMVDFAETLDLPYAIVLTKADKVKKNQYNKHLNIYVKDLDLPSEDALFLTSSETGYGYSDLWEIIESQVNNYDSKMGL